MSSTLSARRITMRSTVPPPAPDERTPALGASADIPIRQRISTHPSDTWRAQLGAALAASGTKQCVLGAVLGKSQPNISAMITGADLARQVNMDNLEAMRDDGATHDAWLELMKQHVGPGYVIERAPSEAFELSPAKVISIVSDTNALERSLLAWPANQGPRQLSFILSSGELVLKGVGTLVYGLRNQRRRGRR